MNGNAFAKVPEATLGFWVIKVLATTLGETGGDAATMSMQLGYAAGSAIFLALLVAAVVVQVGARRFHPFPYWAAVIASTTAGTTLADLVDRSLGIGYAGGSTLLALALLATLALWKRGTGTVDIGSIDSPRAESFYWATILVSQTLGTALGDWTADSAGFGYAGSAMVFGALLLLVGLAHPRTSLPRAGLFWSAFVLTRPLGAVVGDLLDKPVQQGGLELSRYAASLVLLAMVALLVAALPQRAARRAH
ncbi:MAG TPA: hypothetical protein VM619_08610 [Luteimonas sp.]|nr:hypothetical protein [Luteimonas sp.]